MLKNMLKQTKFEDKTVKSTPVEAGNKLKQVEETGKHMFGLSLFRASRQSNISTLGEERFKYPLPWENKISQMPYPRANKDNQNQSISAKVNCKIRIRLL